MQLSASKKASLFAYLAILAAVCTIMNILAGLAEPTSGVVQMDGEHVSGPSLDRGVVFQSYSLLPWLTALKNVTFAVAARFPKWTKQQVIEHSTAFLKKVGLTGDAIHRKPSQLSGGMRQRVSIARAFANEPKLLLLDEPFGALDALTRGTIQDELINVWSQTEQTVFMITHDIDEAILLADRILLMTNGPLARVAESVEITIPRPRNRTEIVEHPNYYAIRNHLVQFLDSAPRSCPVCHLTISINGRNRCISIRPLIWISKQTQCTRAHACGRLASNGCLK
jgi:nitrate/nitrite transport system ATP-binding protein